MISMYIAKIIETKVILTEITKKKKIKIKKKKLRIEYYIISANLHFKLEISSFIV